MYLTCWFVLLYWEHLYPEFCRCFIKLLFGITKHKKRYFLTLMKPNFKQCFENISYILMQQITGRLVKSQLYLISWITEKNMSIICFLWRIIYIKSLKKKIKPVICIDTISFFLYGNGYLCLFQPINTLISKHCYWKVLTCRYARSP